MISTTMKSRKIPFTNPDRTSTLLYPNGNVVLGSRVDTYAAYKPIANAAESISICTESESSPRLLLRMPYVNSMSMNAKFTMN